MLRIALVLSLFFSSVVQAKELSNRLGVGVRNNTGVNISELVASYFPNPDLGVVGGLGIDTEKDASRFTANVTVRRIVFKEENMNFFMGGKIGLVNFEKVGEKQSGFELAGVFGGEFFFQGLESLGFVFEGGVGVVSAKEVRFRTVGEGLASAGVVFYF